MTVPFDRGLLTLTTSVTEPEPPAASAPIDQVTTPAESAPPPVADTNVVLTRSEERRVAQEAPEMPVSDQLSVKVIVPPAATGSRASVADTVRTGDEVTVVVMALPEIGAVWSLLMPEVAILIMEVFAGQPFARTTFSAQAPPAASAPIDQVTTPAESAPPPVADTNVVLTGTVSESTTPVAPEFPVFE